MNAHEVRLMLAFLALLPLAHASDEGKQETAEPRPLQGDYQVYGGSLGDMLPPRPKDRNLVFHFEGQTAKDLFDYIGPDVKKSRACTDDSGYRERRRGHLFCVYWKDNGYRCFLGLDLRTGKSNYGGIC
jgi:hypothetical protein